jgi:phenylacetic acid degradation operon negative regulatory protein
MKVGINQRITSIINDENLRRPLRAKSLVATIFGDVIEPFGGSIWLGDLIELVRLFGVNERLLRTAIYRLAEEGWVSKTRQGRRSIYALSRDGREQTALVHELIYHHQPKTWNGIWNIVVACAKQVPAARLSQLQRRLSLMGFGVLSKNIFAHPDTDHALVRKMIAELGLQDRVPVMQSQTVARATGAIDFEPDRELVKQCCPYEEVEVLYKYFIAAYRPLLKQLEKTRSPRDDACFRLRILLIHDYRRLLFKDPQLPVQLLPADWSGTIARELVGRLYGCIYRQANQHYLRVCDDNLLRPGLTSEFFSRFGGLRGN